ncbi:MAG: DUF4956 domain-containing protein [Planctomycetota bacterium]|nr:DUF4956 domain-containing protein [Planctomycetota bacterium]
MPQLQQTAPTESIYGVYEIVSNIGLAMFFGLVVALVYRQTHKGLSYSQSFTLTIIFVAAIVAIVMMVIGNSMSRAFALVGALSIIRFRTVVKDTKDTAFVFLALAVGMAAGTSNYILGAIGTGAVSVLAMVLHATNFGALYKSEFIIRFRADKSNESTAHLEQLNEASRRSSLLHIEPSGDGDTIQLTYDVVLKEGRTAQELARTMGDMAGVSEVVIIASKSDVDY